MRPPGARTVGRALTALLVLAVGACASTSARQVASTTGTGQTRATTTAVLPGTGRPPVVVGDKNTPEQFVLGELYEQALAAEGFSVSLNRNIGPIQVTIRALQQGTLSMYPEYIDVWNHQVASDHRTFTSSHAAYEAGQQFAGRHGLRLLNPTPFGNTEALAVTDYYAITHGLSTVRDLRTLPLLTAGGPPQFKAGGLVALERAYGLSPPAFKILPLGSQYQALSQRIVQAAAVNTTDGDLASGDYRVLSDPRHVLGWGNVVPVVPKTVLQKEGPTFTATVNAVSALLTLSAMRQLNEQVELHVDPATAAAQFLETHGLVPPSG